MSNMRQRSAHGFRSGLYAWAPIAVALLSLATLALTSGVDPSAYQDFEPVDCAINLQSCAQASVVDP